MSRSSGAAPVPTPKNGLSAQFAASVPPETKVTERGDAPAEPRDLGPRILDDPPRRAALGVNRGRVACRRHRRQRGLPRLRAQRRGRVIIEIGPDPGPDGGHRGSGGRSKRRAPSNPGRAQPFFLAIAGALRAMRQPPRRAPADMSRHTRAPRRPQGRSSRVEAVLEVSAQAGRRSFWRFHARSLFQRSRRSAGRPFSSRQAARRADRGRSASAPAVRRHDEQPDRLQHLLQLRRARLFGAALQLSRRRTLAGRLRSRPGRIVGRGLRARLGAVDQPGGARLLDRRRLLRLLDRHAAPDAAAGDRGLHLDRAARQPLRLQLPRPLPVVRASSSMATRTASRR